MFWAEIWKISEFFIWKISVFGDEIFYIFVLACFRNVAIFVPFKCSSFLECLTLMTSYVENDRFRKQIYKEIILLYHEIVCCVYSLEYHHRCDSNEYSQLTIFVYITKTYLYYIDPLKPHFYIVKLGFTEVYIIFLISAQKHRLWVFVSTASSRRF